MDYKLGYLSLRGDYPSLETLEAHSFPKARHKETVSFEEKINAPGENIRASFHWLRWRYATMINWIVNGLMWFLLNWFIGYCSIQSARFIVSFFEQAQISFRLLRFPWMMKSLTRRYLLRNIKSRQTLRHSKCANCALVPESSGAGSSPGRGHCVVFLSETTLTVPLSIQVYKWVTANLRWFLGIALRIPSALDFRVISARTWARARTKRKRFPSKLDSEINGPFLLNEHGDPHFYFIISMRTISSITEKKIIRNLWLLFWQIKKNTTERER